MIEETECIKLLVSAYSGYRDELVKSVDEWISLKGEFLYYQMIYPLSDLLIRRLDEGDYSETDSLFELVETLLIDGSEDVKNLIATGFLESLQNQTELDAKYWAPLLGKNAVKFCRAMDEFYGVENPYYR